VIEKNLVKEEEEKNLVKKEEEKVYSRGEC